MEGACALDQVVMRPRRRWSSASEDGDDDNEVTTATMKMMIMTMMILISLDITLVLLPFSIDAMAFRQSAPTFPPFLSGD